MVSVYAQHFGTGTDVHTNNTIVHGSPGSGKSYIDGYVCLGILALGLQRMTNMRTRTNILEGIHVHCLFCIPTGNIPNPYHVSELVIQKLTRQSQPKFLYFILPIDVLVIDRIRQLSAEQVDTLDLILPTIQETDILFGDMHIYGVYLFDVLSLDVVPY